MNELWPTNCFELWKEEKRTPKIITMCRKLDTILDGGIQIRKITEICGCAGSGKTQMCLQLCICVQFPKEVGGLAGKAYYIDTNQDFSPMRLKQIAENMEQRFKTTILKIHSQQGSSEHTFCWQTMLNNISYVYCADYRQLLATVISLQKLQDPMVKLVVIDSLSMTLNIIRDELVNDSKVFELYSNMCRLAVDSSLAIVVTNEKKSPLNMQREQVNVDQYLQGIDSHIINCRIVLGMNEVTGQKFCNVGKHPSLLDRTVSIMIKPGGVRSN